MKYDVVILGGGIVGLSSALHLSDLGYSCIVIDSFDLKKSASYNTAGGIYIQLQSQVTLLGKNITDQSLKLIPLAKEIYPSWLRLKERISGINFERTGGIIVASAENEMQGLVDKNKIEQDYQLGTSVLDAQEVQKLSSDFSKEILGATFMPDEGYCEPHNLIELIVEQLKKNKVKFALHSRVQNMTLGSSSVTLETVHNEVYHGDFLLLSAGCQNADLLNQLNINHGLYSLPIQMFSTKPSPINIPALTRYAGNKLSVKKMLNNSVWIGGGWPAQQQNAQNLEVGIISENIKSNLKCAAQVYPKLSHAKVNRAWGGYAAWTQDGLPIIGPCPNHPRVFLACGGNGFSLGPLYAELLSELIQGKESSINISHFLLSRFEQSECSETVDSICLPHD